VLYKTLWFDLPETQDVVILSLFGLNCLLETGLLQLSVWQSFKVSLTSNCVVHSSHINSSLLTGSAWTNINSSHSCYQPDWVNLRVTHRW